MRMGKYDNIMSICERILSMDSTNEKAFELKGDLFKYNG